MSHILSVFHSRKELRALNSRRERDVACSTHLILPQNINPSNVVCFPLILHVVLLCLLIVVEHFLTSSFFSFPHNIVIQKHFTRVSSPA